MTCLLPNNEMVGKYVRSDLMGQKTQKTHADRLLNKGEGRDSC